MIIVADKIWCWVAKVNNRKFCLTKKVYAILHMTSRSLVCSKLIKQYIKMIPVISPASSTWVHPMLSSSLSLRPPECLRWLTHCSRAIIVRYVTSMECICCITETNPQHNTRTLGEIDPCTALNTTKCWWKLYLVTQPDFHNTAIVISRWHTQCTLMPSLASHQLSAAQ